MPSSQTESFMLGLVGGLWVMRIIGKLGELHEFGYDAF